MTETLVNHSSQDSSTVREIRVFISSTFRDMQQERELLVKKVFPELRRICAERLVTLIEVDLRWGITEEEAAEGKVLPVCLAEIRQSRPYFIGLLGERYGWIAQSIDPCLIAEEPWLLEHVENRTSVTELEILHGVLNNPEMAGHAYFYFRHPAYLETVPDSELPDMIERDTAEDIDEFGSDEAARRTEERKARLATLKKRIRESGFPLVDGYADPRELAEAVLRDFVELIDRLYPSESTPNRLERQAAEHDQYAMRKLLAYVQRPVHSNALDLFVRNGVGKPGLVISGETGAGKTLLMADFTKRWRQQGEVVIAHFLGAAMESTSVKELLNRLLGELKFQFGLTAEVPDDIGILRRAVLPWLNMTDNTKRILIILDGLDQLEGDEQDRRLDWLPSDLPAHVRIIASAAPGDILDTLRKRGWEQYTLPLLEPTERDQVIDRFLWHFRKKLDRGLQQQVVSAHGTGNPLFLRIVLEELRQFGSFENLPKKVGEYLSATSLEELFCLVLRRWQLDFDLGRSLVSRSVSLIWAARAGLNEAEWLDLLGDDSGPVDRLSWRPLFLAIEPHLLKRGGQYVLGYTSLRRAVEQEYLPTEQEARTAHLQIANYFAKCRDCERRATELPWQLHTAGDRGRLYRHLLEIDLAHWILQCRPSELREYWVSLGHEGQVGRLYLHAFRLWAEHKEKPTRLNLGNSGQYLELLDSERSNAERVANVANCLAAFLLDSGHPVEAEDLIRLALNIVEGIDEVNNPGVCVLLNNLARVLDESGHCDEAASLLRRVVSILETSLGGEHPRVGVALNNLGLALYHLHNFKEAEPLLRRALEIAEHHHGETHPDVAQALTNLGLLLEDTDRAAEAERFMRRALVTNERLHGDFDPSTANALNNLSMLLLSTNRSSEAESMIRRAIEIDDKSYGDCHPAVARDLNNLAQLLKRTERHEEAEPLQRRVVEIFTKVSEADGREHEHLRDAMESHGLTLKTLGHGDKSIFAKLRELAQGVFGGGGAIRRARKLNNKAVDLINAGRCDEAEGPTRQALALLEQACGSNQVLVVRLQNNLTRVLYETGRKEEAAESATKALKNVASFGKATGRFPPDLETSLANYTAINRARGETDEQIQTRIRSIMPGLIPE